VSPSGNLESRLPDPGASQELSAPGRTHVRQPFLITRLLAHERCLLVSRPRRESIDHEGEPPWSNALPRCRPASVSMPLARRPCTRQKEEAMADGKDGGTVGPLGARGPVRDGHGPGRGRAPAPATTRTQGYAALTDLDEAAQ
jgi:hypothetical protein